MTLTNRLAFVTFSILFALPAAAQYKGRVVTPSVPLLGGPAFGAAAAIKAPTLAAPVLPSLSLPSLQPTLPAVAGVPVAVNAAKAEKPVIASLSAAAEPFKSEEGRSSHEAAGHLGRAFDSSNVRADDPAPVVPGIRSRPRVSGVGLARPFNGVSEENKPEAPAPKKDEEKPMTTAQAVGTIVLLVAMGAASLFMWYKLYEGFYNAAAQYEYQLRQGEVPYYNGGGWEDLFGR